MTKKVKSVLIAIIAIGALAGGGAAIAGAQSSETPPEPSAPASEQAVENEPSENEASEHESSENEANENESAEQVSGPQADEAAQAALDAVGGGTVLEVEGADDGASGFEVEIEVADGSQIEVNLDDNLNVVPQGTDD
jgi:uncharacterized membrane protein YkoI